MKWVLLHRRGRTPLRTQVLSLLEAYREAPVIRTARPLKLSGEDVAGHPAAGCVLELAGRTDTLLFGENANVERRAADGLRFAGRFGFLAEQDGAPVAMALIGGTRLTRGKVGLRLEAPEFTGALLRVDRATETVTVAPRGGRLPFDPVVIAGATIFLTSGPRASAYRVLAARAVAEGIELQLEGDSRIGTGRVTGTSAFRVETSTPFPLHRFRYYHGARLVNAARTVEYRLIEVRDRKAAILDREQHPDLTKEQLAREFPAGSWFDVYDYGVGDQVVWPYPISLTRAEPGLYRLTAPVPVQVMLPAGCRLECG